MQRITSTSSLWLCSILAVALVSGVLSGQTTNWTGAVSTNWAASGNWDNGVPSASKSAVIVSATPFSPSTSGVVGAGCNALTVNSGATLTIPPGSPLDTNFHVDVNGAISGGGLLRFVGGNFRFVSGTGTYGVSIEINSQGPFIVASNLAVTGNLTHVAGLLSVSNGANQTLSVSGNASMQGGSITGSEVFDVGGNVTFSGTAATGNVPTIRCGGNWSSNAAFAPVGGGPVVFDGTGTQTVSVTGGALPGVTVQPGSTASFSTGAAVNGSITVDGTLNAGGALDVNGSFTVAATGTFGFGGGTHTVLDHVSVTGALSGTGTMVMDGGGFGVLSAPTALPNLEIAKTGFGSVQVTGATAVAGNLTLSGGTLQLLSQSMTVLGSATMQGGNLSGAGGAGVLDIAGSVTFSGTATSGGIPNILCGGSWSSNSAFAPAGGGVIFDAVGAQSISMTGGTFFDVTVAASSIASAATWRATGSTTVNGSLTVSGVFDADGPVTIGATGMLDVGGGTDTFGGSLTVNGTLVTTGTVVFDEALPASISGIGSLPNVQISKIAFGSVTITSLTINGNLTQTSGHLQMGAPAGVVVVVTGNASFQGGSLSSLNSGVIDVAGNVTVSGTTTPTSAPTIRCAGNWTADASFAPASGSVELDGTSPSTIASSVAGGTINFHTLVIKNGVRSPVAAFTLAASSIVVEGNGTLMVDGTDHLGVDRVAGPTVFTVNGLLSVAANGELSMGSQTTMTVGSTGTLSLIGAVAQPAKITGHAGGGYGLTVDGTIAANQFLVKETGSGGMVVSAQATRAAPPNDFRNGAFDFRAGAPAGSVLLDLRRNAPAPDFDALAFLNTPGAAGVFNVKTAAGGVPVSLTNATGGFAGPAFENDPNNLITWNLQGGPGAVYVAVRPGAELVEVVWQAANQANVAGYQVRRALNAAGPFALVTTQGPGAPDNGFIDAPLAANQPVFEAVYAVMTQGELMLLGAGSATPYSSATPGNVKKVGGNGTFATIQAAIDAATDPNSVVWVQPGTYASFTVGATAVPSNLRIKGDDSGPVNIDTSSGPIQILNVGSSTGVELSNLHVGSSTSAQNGVVITSCAGPVVLDGVDVACDGTHTAISVASSPKTAIQRSAIQGGTGLSVSSASYVAISRGSLSSLVSTGSTIEMATLTPGSVNVTPPSGLITRPGVMPDMDLPEFISLSFPNAMFLLAEANAPFVIMASPRLEFLTSPSQFEMPFLLDTNALAMLPTAFTNGLGQAVVGFEVDPIAALLGFTFVVQVLVGDPTSGTPRFSNVESMTCIP